MDRKQTPDVVITADIPGRKESDIVFADALLDKALKAYRDSGKTLDVYGVLSAAIYSDVCRILERMDDLEAMFSRDKLAQALGQRLISSVERDDRKSFNGRH